MPNGLVTEMSDDIGIGGDGIGFMNVNARKDAKKESIIKQLNGLFSLSIRGSNGNILI